MRACECDLIGHLTPNCVSIRLQSWHHTKAAVGDDFRAGHVGVVLGHHEGHRLGHLEGLPQTAHAGTVLKELGFLGLLNPVK